MSDQATVEMWQKISTPGSEHEKLAKYTGDWKIELKAWMAPGQPPMETSGTAQTTMMLGGRIRKEEFHADMGGMPFDGWGMTGFDNFKRKFWMTWNDNMFTGILHVEGEFAEGDKAIVMHGYMDKPMANQRDVPIRNLLRLVSDDHYVFEVWEHVGTPQEFQSLEIKYTRV